MSNSPYLRKTALAAFQLLAALFVDHSNHSVTVHPCRHYQIKICALYCKP